MAIDQKKQPVVTAATAQPAAVEENVRAITAWEDAAWHSRSITQQFCERVTSMAGSGPVLAGHLFVFGSWIVLNSGVVSGFVPLDPSFQLLTVALSLEAIFLALFVLASQNRLAQQSERRAHLNLQIDLLAEREMTAVLQLLQDIATHQDVKLRLSAEQIAELTKKTDIHKLTRRLEAVEGTVPAVP